MEKGKWLSSFDLLASSLELRASGFSDVNATNSRRVENVPVSSKQRDLRVHLLPKSRVSSLRSPCLCRARLFDPSFFLPRLHSKMSHSNPPR
jgi:hypothetical protein